MRQMRLPRVIWVGKCHYIDNGSVWNKLRTYKLFKQRYETGLYATNIYNKGHRSALAKCRSGTAPIRLETGRYEGLSIEERLCQVCDMHVVEDEKHVLLECPLYTPTRDILFQKMNEHYVNSNLTSIPDKMICMFTSNECVKVLAKFCYDILNQRRAVFFNV